MVNGSEESRAVCMHARIWLIDVYNGISGETDADYIRCEANKRFNIYTACFFPKNVNTLVPG